MFSSFVLAASNHLLAPANWARGRLQAHAGRTARLSLAPMLEVNFSISGDGHLAQWSGDDAPDVTLKLNATELPTLLAKGSAGLMRDVRIEGNADLADALGFVFRNLRWDAEEDLSRVVGDMAAHRMVSDARAFAGHGRLAIERANANVGEFLVHEAALLTPADALTEFANDLAVLRDRLARLEKRVTRLAART